MRNWIAGETDSALAAFFDHWVTAAPDSYEARMARAMYRWGRRI